MIRKYPAVDNTPTPSHNDAASNSDKAGTHGGHAFKAIENKWQNRWAAANSAAKAETPKPGQPHSYILEMLPYPSGKLHMGHVRNYSIGDAIARFHRFKGAAVLHPMGWDAFGLPAENAAMQNNVHPKTWTLENLAEMRRQMNLLGLSYNWDREVTTCQPDYYVHQQRLFQQFHKKGLMERKESWVNWDPIEHSVLANEQVVNGRGWRSNALVEKRMLSQWSCKITNYAEELLNDLSTLSGWPEKVVKMQENWIGRSEGAVVHFQITDMTVTIPVFTTRPDTLYGCSFVAIAPTHALTTHLAKNNDVLSAFVTECQQMATTEEAISTAEKKGFDTGLFVTHPFDANRSVPLYVANFVLMDYGTGAIFGCPAHDERDFEFATKYNLPIIRVMAGTDPLPHIGDGTIIESDFLNGLSSADAKRVAIDRLVTQKAGEARITYRLRDWLVSRQRYWGCPIPMIHCDSCGVVPVPESNLPVLLPDDVTFDKPGNPLEHHPTWKHVDCPSCGKPARRETDTLDTFFDSSWYFLRYTCATDASTPIVPAEANKWAPVNWYIGGVEHAVMHLLYARFFTKALRDLGYVTFGEPFTNLLTQGMVCHETYQDEAGQWLYPNEVEKTNNGQWTVTKTGKKAHVGGAIKMSKSKKNLVDPLEIMASYGADAARLFMLSDTPPEKDFDWNTEALDGCWRYLNRVSRLTDTVMGQLQKKNAPNTDISADAGAALQTHAHQYLKKICDAYEKNAFNKVIALHREFCRAIEDALAAGTIAHDILKEAFLFFTMTLAPIAPHIGYEMYEQLMGDGASLDDALMPTPDADLARAQSVTIAVQLNGKMRGTFETEPDQNDAALQALATALPSVAPHLVGKTIKKVIVVPNRIVNIVAA